MGVMADDVAGFCARLRPGLVGSLTLYLGDGPLAEELAQEALARAWERWDRVVVMDHPEAWTYRVATNLARSQLRRRSAERRANRRARSGQPTSVDLPDTAEAIAVRAAVLALPRRQRMAIVARFYGALDVEAAAVVLGCSPGTVKALTHQAMLNLRQAGLGAGDRPETSEETHA